MRRIVTFPCEGCRLIGTVDEAPGATGVLVVSGGNEVRTGAHRGMATLAASLAAQGVPVFRFDRRGIGDSEGENAGYASAARDIAAALAAFRREQPRVARVIGFGNCDAATALLLFDHDCDALVIANPWLGNDAAPPPPAALRRHYLRRLADPQAWKTLNLRAQFRRMLRSILAPSREQPLQARIAAALNARPTMIVLATDDRTAQVFVAAVPIPAAVPVTRLPTASHSFADQDAALVAVLAAAVRDLHDVSAA